MIALTLVMMAAASDSAQTFDLADWAWKAPLDTQAAAPGFVRVVLSPEALDQTALSLDDLRVLDQTGQLVPHVIEREQRVEEVPVAWSPIELVNRTYVSTEYARVTLDFGQRVRKNQIRVTLSGHNFRRRVLLEGSAEGAPGTGGEEQWETVLENAWLFDIEQPDKRFKLDVLEFPPNDFQRLRLTVYNMPDDPERIEVEKVEMALAPKEAPPELVPVTIASMNNTWEEKTRESVHELDLGYRNLPLCRIEIETKEPYFCRGFELLGRNAATEKIERRTETGWDTTEREVPWTPIRSGVLHRTQFQDKTTESRVIDYVHAPYRYLQLRIREGDDAPLEISSIKVYRGNVRVAFENQPPNTYVLVGGNPKAVHPQFDLASAVRDIAKRNMPAVTMGPLAQIEHEPKLAPWTERHAYLIWLILIPAAGFMVFLVAKNLSKIRPSE